MNVDVVPRVEDVDAEAVARATVLVIDVLRASTTIMTALANGARAVVPVADAESARKRAGGYPGAILAGERRGEQIPGFDLGNSPSAFTPDRVADQIVILTTSNGTRALLAVRGAAAIGIAGFANASAAVEWARAEGRDVMIACAGERGRVSLEDLVCAGVLVERLLRAVDAAVPGRGAIDAAEAARPYLKDVGRLAHDSSWARHLAAAGYARDVCACLAVDTTRLVPLYRAAVDKVVSGP